MRESEKQSKYRIVKSTVVKFYMKGSPVDCRIFSTELDARQFEKTLDKDVECTGYSRVPRKEIIK